MEQIQLPSGFVEPTPTQEDFTWLDAFLLFPISIPLFFPLYIMNSLAGPNGYGYQKFVPQLLIPFNKRTQVTSKNWMDSWEH